MNITSDSGTTYDRFLHLLGTNRRLYRFIASARGHGWEATPSNVAPDTIIIRKGNNRDHFVLYPNDRRGRYASLTVYDGRDGYEFSPVPARTALSFIATSGE